MDSWPTDERLLEGIRAVSKLRKLACLLTRDSHCREAKRRLEKAGLDHGDWRPANVCEEGMGRFGSLTLVSRL